MARTIKNRNKHNISRKNAVNCAPAPKNVVRPISSSCYSKDALLRLRESYNKKHPDQNIRSKDPMVIWSFMRNNLHECEKEDCWLGQISNLDVRKQLDEMLFAPDRPKDWHKNPNEWLSNFDIMAVLRNYERAYPHFKLLGPSSIDYDTKLPEKGGKCVWEELCKFSLQKMLEKGKTDFGIVFNLDEHDEPGSHWVSMYVDTKNAIIYYYDSALNEIPNEIMRLKDDIIRQGKTLQSPITFKFIHNKKRHQASNTECGMYSLFFIITFLTGQTDFKKNMTIKEKLNLFSKRHIPDKYVEQYRTIYFN